MYKICFYVVVLVREVNSGPLMQEEEAPPTAPLPSLLVAQVVKSKTLNRKVAGGQKHFLRCTSCGRSQRSASWSHCSAFFLPTSPTSFSFFLFLFFVIRSRPGGDGRSFLPVARRPRPAALRYVMLRYATLCYVSGTSKPADTVVMSLFSWQHHWASPPSVTGLQRWGGRGRLSRRKAEPLPPRYAPLDRPTAPAARCERPPRRHVPPGDAHVTD